MALKLSDASFPTCSVAWPVLTTAPLCALSAPLSVLMILVEVSSESMGMVSLPFCCSRELSLALV
jgi:hypothetical protein